MPTNKKINEILSASAEDMVAIGAHDATVQEGRPIDLPSHPDVPLEHYGKVLDVLTQRACDEQFQFNKDSQDVLQLREFERTSRMNLLGSSGFEQLDTFRKETDEKLAKLQNVLRNADDKKREEGLASLRKQRKEEKLALIKKLGTDVGSLEKLDIDVEARFRQIGVKGKDDDTKPLDVQMNDDVPDEVGSFKSGEERSGGRIRSAPYTSAWSASAYRPLTGGFYFENEHANARSSNGEFKNQIAVYNLNAGDFDLAWIEQKGRVGFWYFPFANSGPLEFLIKGISLGTTHQFRIADEIGFSSFSTDQRLWMTASATNGQRSARVRHVISKLELSASPNQSLLFSRIDRTDYRALKVYWFKISLDQDFGTFAPIWIELGFDCRLKTRTNDYSIYASTNAFWHLVGLKIQHG